MSTSPCTLGQRSPHFGHDHHKLCAFALPTSRACLQSRGDSNLEPFILWRMSTTARTPSSSLRCIPPQSSTGSHNVTCSLDPEHAKRARRTTLRQQPSIYRFTGSANSTSPDVSTVERRSGKCSSALTELKNSMFFRVPFQRGFSCETRISRETRESWL